MHFEQVASDYADAGPPYPRRLYETLKVHGVIGPGVDPDTFVRGGPIEVSGVAPLRTFLGLDG